MAQVAQTTVRIADKLGRQLRGRTGGRKDFNRICALLSQLPPGETVLLDFQGVEVVSASWVNSALVPLFQWAANEHTDLFPILTNLSGDDLDEFRLVSEQSGHCFLVVKPGRAMKAADLVGDLDAKQRETLESVIAQPGITGAKLASRETKATAWNNRLKDLFVRRLLRREKRGREHVYWPLVEKVNFNG
jgi:hypothetical protein